MSHPSISRDLALRIGLAARALPDIPLDYLLEILIKYCGMPLSKEKLNRITVETYQNLLNDRFAIREVKRSLSYLQGKSPDSNDLTSIRFYRPGDMPNSIRVAIASDEVERVNPNFNDCERFYIYQISRNEIRLIAIRPANTDKDLNSEQRQYYRAEIIEDCQVLYTTVIGGRAAAKLVNKDVHPVRVATNSDINQLLTQLQYVLAHTPPPWLAKSMGVNPTMPVYMGR